MSLGNEPFSSSSTPCRRPRTKKKPDLMVVEAKISLVRVRAEIHPPLKEGTLHTIDINKGTPGLICGQAPGGMGDHLVAFNYGRHHTATLPVHHDQIKRV